MGNTITSAVLKADSKKAVIYVTIQSDGTNETATTLYDSSAIATTAGDGVDTLDSTIVSLYASSNAASTARIRLLWDATTDVLACDCPVQGGPVHMDFSSHGGLPNQSGSGKTGDINITTTGLASGDSITLVLEVRRD